MAVIRIERGARAGNTFFIDDKASIGRDASQVTIHIPDSKISALHAYILKKSSSYYIKDNQSKNKTYLNGRPVEKQTLLEPGDYINIGHTWIYFGEDLELEKLDKELPSYKIIQKIGEVGHHFKVRQLGLDRLVTLHLLPPNIIRANPHLKKRFRHRARALAKLNHENIAIMLDFEAKESYLYLTTEYIEGERLSSLLHKSSLELTKALEIALGIAQGLAYAHGKGTIHQDISPENIMISESRVILGGFGVASVLSEVKDQFSGLIGKTEYLSPEQIAGSEIDYRSDIYSFGIVLFELLTGRVPFTGKTPEEITKAHLNDMPPALTNFKSDIPAEIERLVYQCLEKECEARPQDVAGLVSTLENILSKQRAIALMKTPDVYPHIWMYYVIKFLDIPVVTWIFLPLVAMLLLAIINFTK